MIRRFLIEKKNYVEAIIGLPANIFYGTSIEGHNNMAARLKEMYASEVAPALQKKFGYKSVMQIQSSSSSNFTL